MQDTGRFQTANASKYLQQLCKHFAHKIEVDYDDKQGSATFSAGTMNLIADASELRAEVNGADADALENLRRIIDNHLVRFAFREGFENMSWQGP